MYTLKITGRDAFLDDVLARYQNREKFLKYCMACKKYNTCWSCPPLNFDIDEYLHAYKYIYFWGIQIFYAKDIIANVTEKGKIWGISMRTTETVKKQVNDILLSVEKKIPDTLSLSSGGCSFCRKCSRINNEVCCKPEKMRYSLDAFGIDLGGLSEDFLRIKLLWSKDRLPQYHTLIHALLSKDKVSEQAMQTVFNELQALS